MAYIDQDFFETYTTTSVGAADFAVLAERSSDVIDMLTRQRIPAAGFENLPASTQAAIKKATAAQLELLSQQGGIDAITGNADTDVTSMAGVTRAPSKLEHINGLPVSPMVSGYLLPTGLMYRGLR